MAHIALTSDTHYGLDNNTHIVHEKFLKRLDKDIKANNVSLLIHAGDWACNKQDQFYRSMKMFRKHISVPIVCVRGNHDLWQHKNYPKMQTYIEMMKTHEEWFKELGIHHLESGPYIHGDIAIFGFDGWYHSANPPTNDLSTMQFKDVGGAPIMPYLSSRAHKKLDALLALDLKPYRRSILVTHHSPFTDDWKYKELTANPIYFEPIVEKFDFFCCGHSHQRVNNVFGKCRVLNSGASYNTPQYLIFEV